PEVGFVEAGIGCFDHRHAQPESGVARDLYAGNGQGFAEGGGWHQTQGGSRQDTEARLESHLLSLKRSHGNHAVTRPPDGAARLSLGCGENVAKGPCRHCNQVNSSGAIPATAMQAGKEMPGQEAPASLRLGVK